MFNFLQPIGKIHPGYNRFIGWSFVTNAVVSTQSVLATHNMLTMLGAAGSQNYMTANYILKDVIGQVGGLYYIHQMGKKVDNDPKKILRHSHELQQSSIILESLTPAFGPTMLVPVAGAANILKNVSFTGYGAVTAKCVQRLAIEGNIGEIYAKVTTVNTIGSTLGLSIGLGINMLVPDPVSKCFIVAALGIIRVKTFDLAVNAVGKI